MTTKCKNTRWKSVLTGIVMMGFASALIWKGITFDYYILGFLYCGGLFSLFTGDGWIITFEKAVFNFIKSKTKKNEGS